MASVLIAGSSHVKRFEQFVNQKQEFRNLHLNPNVCVTFYGMSGGKLTNNCHLEALEQKLRHVSPDFLILHLGGNDLDTATADEAYAYELCLRLCCIAETFTSRFKIKKTVICQLMPRYRTRFLDITIYNELVIKFNKALKRELVGKDFLQYWNLKGVKNSERTVFCDGVHLNNEWGMPIYYRNLRGAIIQCLKYARQY
ncbi:uncharacterized protein LOC133181747 [Saccostrea echinata]|uniref:uncharacterized protein LOC133181747 n=1 Tax=Saccostrea echinata TaxID=191078 RepID=UPI002A82BBAC|nr:uncharacterized protein LOC133181747 [Saccostrea echinata]